MADEQKAKLRLEIAHVLFMDIVGYSKLLTDEQSEALQELNQIVRSTEAAREAEAAGALTVLPTGDGMALVFTGSVEEPVECALEISQALRAQPSLPVRMGIHSGPIHHVKDANGRENIAGVGINIAQRVMDCGDAGHILVSKRVADDLAQQRRWQPYLHELGDVEVKHGVVVSLVNLYAETIGNPAPPSRIGKARGSVRAFSKGARKGLSSFARAIFVLTGLVIALIFVLAIVSVIFAPAIMRSRQKSQATSPPQVPAVPSPPSIADTIKSELAKKVTDALQDALSAKKKATAELSPTGSAPLEKSIAVLPFENLSDDKSNAYFADGIQEEILTRLSRIADLKVISRTSTQHFKSTPENLPAIAKQLGVAHILEGSVQKAADQVRVNVQLINAVTDSHLWADEYDRKLNDIFAVESEIATKIAETLQAKLSGAEQKALAGRPTENTEAHELYLKGRHFVAKRTADDLKRAIDYFNQALAKDPDYAMAYAGIANTYTLLQVYWSLNAAEAFPKARLAAEKALAIDKNLAEGHAALAFILENADLDFDGARREFERAIELNPNSADSHYFFAVSVLAPLGQFDQAIAEAKRALALDPLSTIINTKLGHIYMVARRYPEAVEQLRKTIELDPNFSIAHGMLGISLWLSGDTVGAKSEYEKALSLGKLTHSTVDEAIPLAFLANLHGLSGQHEKALELNAEFKAAEQRLGATLHYPNAIVQIGLGDKEQAIGSLERSFQARDGGIIEYIKVDPMLDPLRGNPRFEALVQKVIGGKPVK